MPSHENNSDRVALPPRFFLYTLDQIAMMLGYSQKNLEATHIFYHGRSIGYPSPDKIQARNIAQPEDKPDWRVVDRELVRWMRRKGYKAIESARITD